MRNSGFTLIEILVVITLGAILSTAGFLSYNNYQIRRSVELSLQELGSTVEQVQRRSVTQEDGDRWSIRFTATSTGEDIYSIYRGDTYSTGSTTQSYSFKRAVHFSEPSGNRTVDFNFEPVSGKIGNKKIITITNNSPHQIAGDVIVNTLGVVTEKMRDNIVGYWHFDEGTGATTTDASGEGSDGSITGTSWQSESSCIAGKCLDFSGQSNVNVGNSDKLNGENGITIEGWFYNPSGTRWISKDRSDYWNLGDYGWEISGGSGVKDINDGAWTSNIPSNEWVYVAATYNPDTGYQAVYINGELDASQTLSPSVTIGVGSDRSVFFGCNVEAEGCASYTYSGKMDEVKIYNNDLSSSTIKDNYNDLK